MTRRIICVAGLAVAVVFACTIAQADTIPSFRFTDDNGTGISADKTYTHLYDMGYTDSPVATVNGVAFNRFTHSGNPLTLTGDDIVLETYPEEGTPLGFNSNTGNSDAGIPDTEGVYDLLSDVIYAHGRHMHWTTTLTGLTSGTDYDLRLYFRRWGTSTRNMTVFFDRNYDGTLEFEDSVYFNANQQDGGFYLSCKYTASDSGTVVVDFVPDNTDSGWHMCGLSNEVVVPEPSTLALLACGLVGLLAYAWRKRK